MPEIARQAAYELLESNAQNLKRILEIWKGDLVTTLKELK